MAIVAAAQGHAARAVRLWAAAATLRYELIIPPSAVRRLEEHLIRPLREALGSDGFRCGAVMEKAAMSIWRQAARIRHDHQADGPWSSGDLCPACICFPH
jgi:hypothetical protein